VALSSRVYQDVSLPEVSGILMVRVFDKDT